MVELRDNLKKSLSVIHPKWLTIFKEHRSKLEDALEPLEKVDINNITPPIELIFATFITNPDDIKVVIMGQDPYPTKGDACGLSFAAINKNPQSFMNIKKCLLRLGYDIKDANLYPWIYQGVMLLNLALTTIIGEKNIHRQYWKPFISAIITSLTKNRSDITFLLWGRDAQSVRPFIKGNNKICEWTHPSPMIDNTLPIEKRFQNCDNFDNLDIDWTTGQVFEVYTDGGVELHKKASYGVYIPNMLRCYGQVEPREYILTPNGLSFQTKNHTNIEPTSQRGEYLAICKALMLIKRLHLPNVTIITDSANSKGILTEWTKKTEKYKNPDLVKIMRYLYNKDIRVVHTQSHGKDKDSPYNEGNDVVDKIASYVLRKINDYETHIDYQCVEVYIE